MNEPTKPVTVRKARPQKAAAQSRRRAQPTKAGQTLSYSKFGQGLRVAAAAATGIVLVTFITSRIYERAFVSYPAQSSYIAADSMVLLSPVPGQLKYLKIDAARGEPVFSLLLDDGRTISVDMPCDCVLSNAQTRVGMRVNTGMPIGEAMGNVPSLYVTALLDVDHLISLYGNPRISVTFVDGETVSAAVGDLPRINALEASRSGLIRVKLKPERALSPAELGQPVTVAFDRFPTLLPSWSTRVGWLWPDNFQATEPQSTSSMPGKGNREVSM